ncbi:hypothetical protein F2Q69_00044658 [Brassica cretica]|uniref:Uncharacterized protein n=1 Tax=Brassica cretica TaxID=69181 RepID=A0A8S9NIG2_BRACR|nr:hypothetical protein F2Q69_00044658 [Brassica cretica]
MKSSRLLVEYEIQYQHLSPSPLSEVKRLEDGEANANMIPSRFSSRQLTKSFAFWLKQEFEVACCKCRAKEEVWIELGVSQIWVEFVNRVADFEKYEEFPRSLVGYTDPSSSSRSFEVRRSMALSIMKWMDFSLKECGTHGLRFLRASPVFLSRSARYHAQYISGGTIRACSKAYYRSESVMFHWLFEISSLGVVLVDLLEDSSSATELLRFLGHMARCFREARCTFGSSSF